MVGMGHLESENGTTRNEPSANSVVVRESIADAHKTRQMWQQMANTNEAQSLAHPIRTANSRPPWACSSAVSPPSSTNSLPRKASSDSHQNGDVSPTQQIRWRPGSGPSTQMERQIKEHRRQSESLVRNTIQGFEHEILASNLENGGARPLLYSICSQMSEHQLQPPNSPFGNPALDSLENEKLLFMNYIQTHPEVVKSLGISVPWQVIPERPPSVKVELAVVDPLEGFYSPPNGHASMKSSSVSDYSYRNGTNGVHKYGFIHTWPP